MDGCVPCYCGSDRLIPDVYMGEPTLVRIRCIECNQEGDTKETSKEAILAWNGKITRGDDDYGRKTK